MKAENITKLLQRLYYSITESQVMLPTSYLYLSQRKIPQHGTLSVPVHTELLDLQLLLPHELLSLRAENPNISRLCGAAL